MHALRQKKVRRILSLMSGTSCDGLDMALIEITGSGADTRFTVLASHVAAYSEEQKRFLLQLIQSNKITLREVSQLNFYLPRLWSEQIAAFFDKSGFTKNEVDVIASHGQTIWHQPQRQLFHDCQVSSTLQLGDPTVLANLCSIPVIGDFRVADVALGGQGAPLIPYFD